ncbi:unnamed protein product, partial [Pylaiella littoralis]
RSNPPNDLLPGSILHGLQGLLRVGILVRSSLRLAGSPTGTARVPSPTKCCDISK